MSNNPEAIERLVREMDTMASYGYARLPKHTDTRREAATFVVTRSTATAGTPMVAWIDSQFSGYDSGTLDWGGVYRGLSGIYGIINTAIEKIKSITSLESAQEEFAISILHNLRNQIVLQNNSGNPKLSDPPPFLVSQHSDGAVSIEWIFPHFRAGFHIERELKESSWTIQSDDNLGSADMLGFLREDILQKQVLFVWNYISENG